MSAVWTENEAVTPPQEVRIDAKIERETHKLEKRLCRQVGQAIIDYNMIEETIEADIAAIELELKDLTPATKPQAPPRQQPKRAALPAGLPRVAIHH